MSKLDKLDRDVVLGELLELCEELGRIPMDKEIYSKGIIGCSKTLKRICQEKGYEDRFDYCRNNGYADINDVVVNGKFKTQSKVTLEELVVLFNEFYNIYGAFPMTNDCMNRNEFKYNLPNKYSLGKVLKQNNLTLNEFYQQIGNNSMMYTEKARYDEYIKKYKELSNEKGSYITYNELSDRNIYGLPKAKWLVDNCPDGSVGNFQNFVEWCGFIPVQGASKEVVIKTIYNMQSKLDRPLMLSDLTNPNPDEIGVGYIIKYWGNLNNMKKELGLKIVKENMMARQQSYLDMKLDLVVMCNTIYKQEKRTTITTHDIDEYCKVGYNTYFTIFKNNNTTVREFIEQSGFKLQDMGVGFNYHFEDGESVYSRYEYDFSRLLREYGFVYNLDYFRDIKYREFIDGYEGLLNCDYVLHLDNKDVYIEIGGMLRDHECEYYNDKVIKSGIKEEYRKTLMIKRKMLEDNNLNHHIVLPRDCNEGFFNEILHKGK